MESNSILTYHPNMNDIIILYLLNVNK